MRFPQDVPVLTDGIVTLRAHHEDDVPPILEQCTDERTVRWTSIPSPYVLDDAKRFVREHAPGGWREESELSFAIEVAGQYAGTCSVRVQPDRRGDVGYVVHPAVRGRGVMERALRLMLDWAFATERFDTMVWWAQTGNWASRRVAWKLGFSCHGPLEQWLAQRGTLQDCWVGVLRREDEREPRHPWFDAPRIHGRSTLLRPIHHGDALRVAEAFADPTSQRWLRLQASYSEEEGHGYVEERRGLMAEGKIVYWTFADPGTDDALGGVMLFEIEPGKDAELGYWTHPAGRGRGLTTEAARMAVRHAFVPEEDGGMGLSRVTAYAGTGNAASLAIIERLGFTRYGVERLGGRNGRGEVFDLACYDLLASELSAP